MESKVEALEANRKKVAVTVDAAEVDSRIKAQYKDFARKYHFPGFRKGKAPRPVIDSVLGKEAVAATVTEDIISSLYPLALDDNDLVVMGQPEFEDTDDMVEQGKPYRFAFTVETRPEFELVSYEPLSVKLPSEEPTEEEIDGQIKELLDYYYTFEDCADDAQAGEGGFVEVALDVKDAEGQDVAALSTDSRLYEMGGGLFPKSFDEALMDMRKGDAKTVEIDFSVDDQFAAVLHRQYDATVNHTPLCILRKGKCLIHLEFKLTLNPLDESPAYLLSYYREIRDMSREDLSAATGIPAGEIQNAKNRSSITSRPSALQMCLTSTFHYYWTSILCLRLRATANASKRFVQKQGCRRRALPS